MLVDICIYTADPAVDLSGGREIGSHLGILQITWAHAGVSFRGSKSWPLSCLSFPLFPSSPYRLASYFTQNTLPSKTTTSLEQASAWPVMVMILNHVILDHDLRSHLRSLICYLNHFLTVILDFDLESHFQWFRSLPLTKRSDQMFPISLASEAAKLISWDSVSKSIQQYYSLDQL